MKDATQINTAVPLVVKSENYADRLARWMEDERRRKEDAIADKFTAAIVERFVKAIEERWPTRMPEPPK